MGENVRSALSDATTRLASVSDTARLDAELLMAHALGVSREAMIFGHLDVTIPATFEALLQRRLAHEPIAYIIGTRAFWTIDLIVSPALLIPRADSETLIEAAVDHFEKAGPKRVLDLGTGSGALLLAALDQWRGASGLGVDASEAALNVARRNANNIAPGRAEMRMGDWGQGIAERFDLILCNPPYVESGAALERQVADHEPSAALYAGPDGLDDYRQIIPQLASLIAPNGLIALEIGHTQREAVSALFAEQNMVVTCRKDLGGRDRAILHFALG